MYNNIFCAFPQSAQRAPPILEDAHFNRRNVIGASYSFTIGRTGNSWSYGKMSRCLMLPGPWLGARYVCIVASYKIFVIHIFYFFCFGTQARLEVILNDH